MFDKYVYTLHTGTETVALPEGRRASTREGREPMGEQEGVKRLGIRMRMRTRKRTRVTGWRGLSPGRV